MFKKELDMDISLTGFGDVMYVKGLLTYKD